MASKAVQVDVSGLIIQTGGYVYTDQIELYMGAVPSESQNISFTTPVDTQPLWTGPAPPLGTVATARFLTRPLTRGRWWFAVKAKDQPGNETNAYTAKSIQVDTPPAAPLNLRVQSYTPATSQLILQWDAVTFA